MTKSALYNGRNFPEFTFTRKDISYVFMEFDAIFDDAFLVQLEKFMLKYDISKINVENIEPKLFEFNHEVEVFDFVKSFKQVTCTENPKSYFNTPASFFMLTEEALIYTNDNEQPFCIILDRSYWIAIVGVSNPAAIHYFSEFNIGDVLDYLSASFNNDLLTDSFKTKLIENWH